MSRTFEGDFEHLLKAIREWAEIGNPMPAKNANEKLSWLFQQYGIVPDTPAGREQQLTGSVFVIPKSMIPEIHEITSWVGEPATHAIHLAHYLSSRGSRHQDQTQKPRIGANELSRAYARPSAPDSLSRPLRTATIRSDFSLRWRFCARAIL